MGMSDYKFLLGTTQAFTADGYSTDEINFGITNPNPALSGNFGLNVVVTTAFTGMASGVDIGVVHGASTAPTTKHTSRRFAVGDLTLGKHIFIPLGGPLLQYARMQWDVVSESATAGALTSWFGPGPIGAKG